MQASFYVKEFCYKIGAAKLIKRLFHINDSAMYRTHKGDDNLLQVIYQILCRLRKVVRSIKMPEFMLFEIDTTLLDAYGDQEGVAFNYHYQDKGCYRLFAFDGLTGDLMKAELRDGTQYCSKGADAFMESLLEEFREDFPDIPLYLRGGSGLLRLIFMNPSKKGL